VQSSGGVLLAEAALRALRDGGRIIAEAARIEPATDGVRVRSASEDVRARQVIVAAGPWIGGLVPDLTPLLSITRQTVGWFAPARPDLVELGRLPIFLLEGPHGLVYGFPDFEGRGVKVARHDHGPMAVADAWDPPASDAELAPVRATLEALVPPPRARSSSVTSVSTPTPSRPTCAGTPAKSSSSTDCGRIGGSSWRPPARVTAPSSRPRSATSWRGWRSNRRTRPTRRSGSIDSRRLAESELLDRAEGESRRRPLSRVSEWRSSSWPPSPQRGGRPLLEGSSSGEA